MNCYLINARKTPRNHHYRFKWATTFFRYSFLLSLIHSLSRECAYTRFFPSSPESLFFALPSICFLSFLFFISRWNPAKEHRYVKRSSTLFGALFRRRFSSRLYPILLFSPPSFPFRFYYFIPSRLFHTHCLFLSWRSPLIQSRLNYAGFSSGDSKRKGGGKKNKIKTGVAYSVPLTPRIKKKERKKRMSYGDFLLLFPKLWCRCTTAHLTVSFFRPYLIQTTFLPLFLIFF